MPRARGVAAARDRRGSGARPGTGTGSRPRRRRSGVALTRDARNPFAALSEYELRNLAAHLQAAGHAEQLHRVLALSGADGRNGWYEARLAHGDGDAYLADVARGWTLASAAADVGLETRYALMTTTLNSLAQNVPPELVIAALAAGVWSGRRALAFVAQLQAPAPRAAALAKIAPHLEGSLREQALAALVAAMTAAADGAPERETRWALPDELPEATVAELVPLAESIADAEGRANALEALALRLDERSDGVEGDALIDFEQPSDAQLEAALGKVRRLTPLETRLQALAALAPRLPAPLLAEAVEQARAGRSKRDRALMLAELAPHHSEPARAELQDEALALARTIRADQGRALALAAVAARLPSERREAVIDESLESLEERSIDSDEVLVRLAPYLSPRQADIALAVARAIDEPLIRGEVLAALSQHLPARLNRSVLLSRLAAARAEDYAPFRIDALAALMPLLSRKTQERVGREALDAVRSLGSGSFRATHLARLAPHLPDALLRDAIDAAQAIADRAPRSLLLLALARSAGTSLEPAAAADALAETRERPDVSNRAPILVQLAPYLSAAQLEEALELVLPGRLDFAYGSADAGVDSAKAQVVAAVAPHLPAELLPKALELAETIGYLEERSQALAALAPYLPPPLLENAVAVARRIPFGAHASGKQGGWRHHRADALAALAPYLPEPARSEVLEEAVETARAIEVEQGAAEQLVALVPHRPELADEAVRAVAADDLPDEALADAVVALAPYVSKAPRALKLARSVREPAARARALIALAAGDALDAARQVDDDVRRVSLLAEIAALLHEPERRHVVAEAFETAQSIDYRMFLSERAVISLAPLLEPEERAALLEHALADALALRPEGLDPNPKKLIALVPLVAPAEQGATLREALRGGRSASAADPDAPQALDLTPVRDVPAESLHAALSPTLRELVSDSRPMFVQRLCDLVPLIVAVGGRPAAESTRDAVVAVTAWWP